MYNLPIWCALGSVKLTKVVLAQPLSIQLSLFHFLHRFVHLIIPLKIVTERGQDPRICT
jgi:hypothetical protein